MEHAKLHIICGNCGVTEMSFKIDENSNDVSNEKEEYEPAVFVSCENCSTLHDLGFKSYKR